MDEGLSGSTHNGRLPTGYAELGVVVWAVVGFTTAMAGLSRVNNDARWLVVTASIVGPLSAFAAAVLIRRGLLRWAGVLLIISVTTPTYFAWPLNVPALVFGVLLIGGLQLKRNRPQQQSMLPILDFPPDTRAGNVFTVILLTIGNGVVPLVSYLWGVIRLTQTRRWRVWQKIMLALIFPLPFVYGAVGLFGPVRGKTSVVCVAKPGISCPKFQRGPFTTLSPQRSPDNTGISATPSRFHLELVGQQSVTVGKKFRVQLKPVVTGTMRGGYYWLTAIPPLTGVHRALLWSEKIQGGIPGGSTDPTHWDILAFAVTDPGPDTLILPDDIAPYDYELCLASSVAQACMNLVVTAGS
jgi:hypothetical protein